MHIERVANITIKEVFNRLFENKTQGKIKRSRTI